VDEHHVQPIDAQAFQAVFDGAARTVGRIVRHPLVGQLVDERFGVLRRAGRLQQPADLGAEHELVTRLA